ncbi:MAG: PLP-dependent aminotransferase family protein [Anaerocolumna sp.]
MLTVPIDTTSSIPIYEQLYGYIKNEIKNRNLPIHSKLPSTRNLSKHLGISRNTVDMAYAQLLSEGYINAIPKSGYYINEVTDLTNLTPKKPFYNQEKVNNKEKYLYDFSPFAIDIKSFPYNIWRKLQKDCMNDYNNDLFLLGENQGDMPLRQAITAYLHSSRGVNCSSEQIVVGAGADYLLLLLTQILKLTTSSLSVAMENPTYKRAYHIFMGMDIPVTPVDLDQSGLILESLYDNAPHIVYVTPSHQYPLGVVMPIKRRLELLKWASLTPNRYIIEDDHDSEFRYKGKPIPSLQGMDTADKVIYLGTFSRSIAPAIRVGYMVLPKDLLLLYQNYVSYYSCTVSRVDQYILTRFINDGYFERHLNRIRTLYKNKHDILMQALKKFKDKIQIEGEHAGLHLVVKFPTIASEEIILEKAKICGIKLHGLTRHYIVKNEEDCPTILLGYANLSEESIIEGLDLLYENIKDLL